VKVTNKSSLHILLAEDEDIYQEIIERYIKNMGLQLTIVDNGAKCLEESQEGSYDIILMDIEMPEKDGLETTQELRKRGIDIPIIAVTSNTWREDQINSIDSGMNDFLPKPFNRSKLARMINYWAERKGSTV
jgi:CheY-like chemotaxis protein